MAQLHITSVDGLWITIERKAGDLDGHELQRAAILELIENADAHHWEKHDEEAGHAFYEAVLTAVVQHYMVDDPDPRSRPIYVLLQEMIEDLRSSGRLNASIDTGPIADE